MVILAVKPQIMSAVLKDVAGAVIAAAAPDLGGRGRADWPPCARRSASPRA